MRDGTCKEATADKELAMDEHLYTIKLEGTLIGQKDGRQNAKIYYEWNDMPYDQMVMLEGAILKAITDALVTLGLQGVEAKKKAK